MVTALAVAAAVFSVAWAWRSSESRSPHGDPSSLFTIGTQPAELPPAALASEPGFDAYVEGQRKLRRGDAPGAIASFAAAVQADPANARYREASASALWEGGERAAALADYAEAARLDPAFQLQNARALDVAGRSAEAVVQYLVVLERNPENETVRVDLGRLLFRTGDYARAGPLLQAAVGTRPEDPVLRQEYAYSLQKAGQREEAMAAYRDVLARAPQAVISRSLLAENLVAEGNKQEALSLLDEGLQSTPGVPLLHRQKGAVLESMGRWAEAAAEYREYGRLASNAEDAGELADRAARLERARREP